MRSPTIRPARQGDLEAITAIYNEAGVGTTASYDIEPVTVADLAGSTQVRAQHVAEAIQYRRGLSSQ